MANKLIQLQYVGPRPAVNVLGVGRVLQGSKFQVGPIRARELLAKKRLDFRKVAPGATAKDGGK